MADSFFAHEQKIKTPQQMMETLKARTSRAVGQSPKSLHWEHPVRNKDGSGHQIARGTEYLLRKTFSQDKWIYWAWWGKKLLGYSHDVELARTHCQTHFLNQP